MSITYFWEVCGSANAVENVALGEWVDGVKKATNSFFAVFIDLIENAFNLKKKSMWGRVSISLETPGNAEPQEDVNRPQML